MSDDTLLRDFVGLINQVIAIQVDPTTITRRTSVAHDLMLDSISLVSLMTLSEECFGISLAQHTESIANIQTVGDALELIASLRADQAVATAG